MEHLWLDGSYSLQIGFEHPSASRWWKILQILVWKIFFFRNFLFQNWWTDQKNTDVIFPVGPFYLSCQSWTHMFEVKFSTFQVGGFLGFFWKIAGVCAKRSKSNQFGQGISTTFMTHQIIENHCKRLKFYSKIFLAGTHPILQKAQACKLICKFSQFNFNQQQHKV